MKGLNGCRENYPVSTGHTRNDGHPGFSSGFPPKACGNDVLGLWTPSSVVLFLAQSAQ
jgi:hypothetical protein